MKKRMFCILTALLVITSFSSAFAATESFGVKNHSYDEGIGTKHSIQIDYPVFSGFSVAKTLNQKIADFLNTGVTEIKQAETDSKNPNITEYSTQYINFYDYFLNNDILSLSFDTYAFTGGAHGMNVLSSYTLNTKTGEFFDKFSALFKNGSPYEKVIYAKITTLMKENPSLYFEDAQETIKKLQSNYQYYLDGNELVIYFNQYEIAPYSSGRIYFRIPVEELKDLLKDEIYNACKDQPPSQTVKVNGVSQNITPSFYLDGYTPMLPLRTLSELLGYEVKWENGKGALINGKEVNSDTKTATKEGILYVPITYFTETLQESIYFNETDTSQYLKIFIPETKDTKIISSTN